MTKAARDFLPEVAKRTEGYSGSDLKEVCRAAAWEPVRELTTGASKRAVGCGGGIEDTGNISTPFLKRTSSGFPSRGTKARPVCESDFLLAIQKVKKTGESARQFNVKEFLRGRDERASMQADISRASKASTNGRGNQGNNKQVANVDIEQIMAMAMAAAASMNSSEGGSTASEDGKDEDGDDVPDIWN